MQLTEPRGAVRRAPASPTLTALAVGALVGGACLVATGGTAQAATAVVQAFPRPGSSSLAPASQISFRGVASLGSVEVRGSRTGLHPGRVVEHSDRSGASFVPSTPFAPGESVTVRTGLDVAGGDGGTFRYTVARPAPVTAGTAVPGAETSAPQGVSPSALVPGPYRSRPDLHPPAIATTDTTGRQSAGLLFASSGVQTPATDTGVLVYGDGGDVVWFNPLPPTGLGTLQPIRYRGQSAITWFTGTQAFQGGFKGSWIVADTSYRQIGEITAGNGLTADGHELRISPDGTRALLCIYQPVITDMTSFGGPVDAVVYEAVVQEVDLATQAVTFEWHSLDDSPLTDTLEPLDTASVDYFHVNALDYDTDGGILVSGRHVSQILKLDRAVGADGNVAWRLGGRRSTIAVDPADTPSYPHDVRRRPDGTISLYDNGVRRVPPFGRGMVYRVDETARTATATEVLPHDPALFGPIVGSSRLVPGGGELVSYGNTGTATEYDAAGAPVWESRMQGGAWSYRTLRVPGWVGTPAEAPALSTERAGSTVTGYASWNGSTETRSWALLAGPSASQLRQVGAVTPRTGFETRLTGTVTPADVVVVAEARAADGSPLRRSSGTDTTTPIAAHYNALGGAASVLGAPVGPEEAVAGGTHQAYERGDIWNSLVTGAWEVHGDIRAAYLRNGGVTGTAGFPITDERTIPDGGRYNLFASGAYYWTPQTGAHEVHGLIGAKWSGLGSQSSFLGYPVTDEQAAGGGAGRVGFFQNGAVYHSEATGTREVHGRIRDHWSVLGAENGLLGFPVSDELRSAGGTGRTSRFQRGSVLWSEASGAHAVGGAIADAYAGLGEDSSVLGFPVTDEGGTPDGIGRYSVFQSGVTYWTEATGAHEVHGAILGLWGALGLERSTLGYPTSDEYAVPGGRRSDFQNGSIIWRTSTGLAALVR